MLSPQVLAGPAGLPPPGIVSNFDNPPTLDRLIYTLIGVAWVIMSLATAMRLFTRWYITKTPMIEDFYVIVAYGLNSAYNVVCIMCAKNGAGVHMWNVRLSSFLTLSQWINIVGILYGPCATFTKLAILLQFLHLFAPTRRTNQWMFFSCWILILVTVVFYTIYTFLVIFRCSPRKKIWEPSVPGYCVVETTDLFLSAAFFNVITDVMILVLPISETCKLHVRIKQKLAVSTVFAAGTLAIMCAIWRLVNNFAIINGTDTSYQYAYDEVLAVYELTIGALVFCLPVAPKFFTFVQEKAFSVLPAGYYSHDGSTESNLGKIKPPSRPRQQRTGLSIGIPSVHRYVREVVRSVGQNANELSSRSTDEEKIEVRQEVTVSSTKWPTHTYRA